MFIVFIMPWNPEFKANCFFKVAQGSWYSTNEGYQTAQDDRNDRVPKVQKTIKYDQPYKGYKNLN